MVSEKTTKVIALSIVVAILALSIASPDFSVVGISRGASWRARLAYPFFHVNLLHCLFNAWTLLAVAFLLRPKPIMLMMSYIIAISIPTLCLSEVPTVGLSGVIFSLCGYAATIVRTTKLWLWVMAVNIAVGFVIPCINGWVHAYCFSCGLLVGLLIMPIPCRKK